MKGYKSLFGTPVETLDDFIRTFVWYDGKDIQAGGLVWEVDDVGIISVDDVKVSRLQCNAHFVFWDRKLRGREPLVKEMCRYGFEEFGLHRIVAEIPLHALPVVKFVERCGFVEEGRLRETTMHDGEWWDSVQFSMLRSDLDGEIKSRAGREEDGGDSSG